MYYCICLDTGESDEKPIVLYLLVISYVVGGGCSTTTPEMARNERLAEARRAQVLADELRAAVSASIRPSTFILYSAKPIPDDPERNFNQREYLAEMETVGASGGAFSMGKRGLVVTVAHVIEGELCKTISHTDKITQWKTETTYCALVTQTHDKAFLAKVLQVDKKRDVAVLQIQNLEGEIPFLKPAPTGSFGEGTAVITVGTPLGYNNFTISGYINSTKWVDMEEGWGFRQRHVQFIAPLQPGNSGGPLVSLTTGEVVGLITWVRGANVFQTHFTAGLCQATPIEVVMEVLAPYM